jgi:hypothetical protein
MAKSRFRSRAREAVHKDGLGVAQLVALLKS